MAILISCLDHALVAARVAVSLDRNLVLISQRDALFTYGIGWFSGVARAIAEAEPACRCRIILDCADQAGAAQGAMRVGLDIVFSGHPTALQALEDIAAQRGCNLFATRPDCLDLASVEARGGDLAEACRQGLDTPAGEVAS